jgi:hypothetical protein
VIRSPVVFDRVPHEVSIGQSMDGLKDRCLPVSKRCCLQHPRSRRDDESRPPRAAFHRWARFVSMSVNARLIQRRWLHKLLQPVFAHDQGYQNALTYYVLTRGPASSTIERKAAPPTFPTWRNQDTATARVLNAHPLFNPASNGALCYSGAAISA